MYFCSVRNITVSGGTLAAESGTANGSSFGLYGAGGYVTVTGGTLTAKGGTSNNSGSYGAQVSNITVSGGTFTAEGGQANGGNSNGVYFGVSITVSGGTFKATGGTASSDSHGIKGSSSGSVTLTGGVTTAKGNTQAVNKQPAFSDTTQTNGNWYRWKESAAASEPADYTVSTTAQQFTNDTSVKYLKVAPLALPISVTPDTAFPVGMSGGDRTVTVGHGTGLVKGEIGALSVGGDRLTEGTDYTKANGASVDITLKESWLNTLPAGTHRLHVPVTSGAYAPQTPYIDIVVTGTGGADVPNTGDSAMPLMWAGLALLAGAGLVILRKRRRVEGK